MKTVYYDSNGPTNQQGFRGGGSAWWVSSEPDRPWDENFAEFALSEHLYSALFHLGVIEGLCELPHDGLLGAYEEGILWTNAALLKNSLTLPVASTKMDQLLFDLVRRCFYLTNERSSMAEETKGFKT